MSSSSELPPLSPTICLNGLLDALPHAAAIFDSELLCQHRNQAFTRLVCAATSEHPECATLAALLPSAASHIEALMHGPPKPGPFAVDFPTHITTQDGQSQRLLLSINALDPSNIGNASPGFIVQLRASAPQARRVLNNLFAFVGLLTPDGTLEDANRAPLEAGGLTLSDVYGKKIWDTYWFCHDTKLQQKIRDSVEIAARGEVSRYDITVRMKEDSRMTIDFMISPLRDDDGLITHLIPSAIDISSRTHSEEALRQSEERFRCVVEAAPDGLAMVDRDGRLALVNSCMERMFGYPREELLGQTIEMLIPTRYRQAHPNLRSKYMNAPTTRDMAGRRELYALRKDGSEFPVEIGLNALSTVGGEHVLAAIVDVTKRKADQAILEQALDEKTVLLNEVHHRVKNNLQVICSLLNLQARTANQDVRTALEDSQTRIKTMSLIHQLLYERSDFSSIDLGLYLRRLGSLLRDLLGEARTRVTLNIKTDNANIIMDLQRSVPCGLLVNELLTNAIKHAFPHERHGEITVHTELLSPTLARIIVSDNGVGIPAEIKLGDVSSSLGFQLIPLFVDQLGGELRLIRENGSRFELYFKPGMGRD